jgi:hypothetical protein
VLSDPALRASYNAATEYDVECMEIEEYLARFQYLILTVNGLGTAGWGEGEGEHAEPLLLSAPTAGACVRACVRDDGETGVRGVLTRVLCVCVTNGAEL